MLFFRRSLTDVRERRPGALDFHIPGSPTALLTRNRDYSEVHGLLEKLESGLSVGEILLKTSINLQVGLVPGSPR